MKKTTSVEFDPMRQYELTEAVKLLRELSTSKFVGSVDIDIVLDLNEKQRKESLKGSVVFPHQFGGAKKVIAFVDDKDVAAAESAGASAAGLDELIKKVEKGSIEFDVVVATPTVMAKIAKLGKVLGPKGLMPNPANGTVAADVAEAIRSFASGKQNFKMNEQGAVRARVAKLDMDEAQISANITAFIAAVSAEARKFGSSPIKKITLSPTMGKGVKLTANAIAEASKA